MGNPFVHIELNTDNMNAARKFYAKVFDWKIADMGMQDYLMVDTGKGKTGGGMQPKMMAEAPSAWLPYVEVADVKKTVAKAKANGAQVVLEYQAIGEMGAIGIFMDPSGAALGVWQSVRKAPAKKKKAAGKKR